MAFTQQHVSEIPDNGPIVECTWATGVELARAALDGSPRQPPATTSEREALRIAGGGSDTGGANYDQLALGFKNRYGLVLPLSSTLPAAPPRGTFYGVQGEYGALPDHYRRWDGNFTAGHSAVVYNLDGTLMWCDPLAPWNLTLPGGIRIPWQGEPIAWSVVAAYFRALPGAKVATTRLPAAPATWHMDIAKGTTDIQYAGLSASGCVSTWYHQPWGGGASSAPCRTPVQKVVCSSGARETVALVTAGLLAGKLVRENGGVSFSLR